MLHERRRRKREQVLDRPTAVSLVIAAVILRAYGVEFKARHVRGIEEVVPPTPLASVVTVPLRDAVPQG